MLLAASTMSESRSIPRRSLNAESRACEAVVVLKPAGLSTALKEVPALLIASGKVVCPAVKSCAPAIDVIISEDAPSPLNPMGLKGAGEGGVNAVGAAIAAAIDDALGMPGAVKQLPITPQRLRALLRQAERAAS